MAVDQQLSLLTFLLVRSHVSDRNRQTVNKGVEIDARQRRCWIGFVSVCHWFSVLSERRGRVSLLALSPSSSVSSALGNWAMGGAGGEHAELAGLGEGAEGIG